MYKHCYLKENKLNKALKSSFISILSAIIVQFIIWIVTNEIFKNLTNEEKEELEIFDFISAVLIGAINGFINVYLPKEAFLFAASIIAVLINDFVDYIVFNKIPTFSLIEEIILTIISLYIVIFIIANLFENTKFKDNDITYSIIMNIIIFITLTVDFSVYEFLFSNVSKNEGNIIVPVAFE